MHIDFVAANQYDGLVSLMHEMCIFYSDAEPVSIDDVRSNLLDNLLAPTSPVRLVVASAADGAVVWFAAIAMFHSMVDPTPGRRGQMLLKELYVRQACQKRGIGKALMSWLARHAIDRGCARMDWHVSATNKPALAFYRALNAQHVAGRLNYRLGGEYLARLADEDEDEMRA